MEASIAACWVKLGNKSVFLRERAYPILTHNRLSRLRRLRFVLDFPRASGARFFWVNYLESSLWQRLHRDSKLYVVTDVGYPTKPINSYHILFRLILINCQKRALNSLFETSSELKHALTLNLQCSVLNSVLTNDWNGLFCTSISSNCLGN